MGLPTACPTRTWSFAVGQFRVAENPQLALAIAQGMISGKIRNCRTLLRRNHQGEIQAVLGELARVGDLVEGADSAETLLALEGAAAKTYFAHFAGLIKADEDGIARFDFVTRNRRPPGDPVNALLSFLYAILAKDATVTLQSVGFDPMLGFFHRPRYGRPSLALDLMEEFRPLVVDSTVLSVVNNREVGESDFVRRGESVVPDRRGEKEGARRVRAADGHRGEAPHLRIYGQLPSTDRGAGTVALAARVGGDTDLSGVSVPDKPCRISSS